jgi:hypothetical protein
MKARLKCLLLEVTIMLLGDINKKDIKLIERCLFMGGHGSACQMSSDSCLAGKSSWLVVCIVAMVRARMELQGRKASPSVLEPMTVS